MAEHKQLPYNEERIAQILAEATMLGDHEAAKKHGITTRTIKRYRSRARADASLGANLAAKQQLIAETWQKHAESTIHFLLDAIEAKVRAGRESLRDINGSLHIVCSHKVASDALTSAADATDRQPNLDSASQAAPEGSGGCAGDTTQVWPPVVQ